MRLLITGGAGFIGSHIADALLRAGHRVRAYDVLDRQVHPDRKRPDYLDQRVELIVGDMRDRDGIVRAIDDVDAIFHFAAVVGVGQSQYEISRYTAANVEGTATLLDVLANEKHNVKKIVVVSSMSIYGEGLYVDSKGEPVVAPPRTADDLAAGKFDPLDARGEPLRPVPTPESKPPSCESIYALNKKDQEEYCLLFGRTYGIPVVALRLFNTYGARQSLNNPYTGAAAIFISRVQAGVAPMIYEDGNQQRDFVDVRDVARAALLALESEAANHRVLNVGSGRPISIADLASMIAKVAGSKLEPQITNKTRKGDIRHCFADISAIRAIGFEPSITLERGLRDLYDWTAQQPVVAAAEQHQEELRQRSLIV